MIVRVKRESHKIPSRYLSRITSSEESFLGIGIRPTRQTVGMDERENHLYENFLLVI